MKNNFYKKLLSIILTAMLILATIPFSCISVLAEEAGVDLVKIAPTANPPVCRIVDYGKFKYEQLRKEK